jgi:DNA primase
MIDVVSFLPAKRKHTSSGWISFNAPCCIHRGDSQDKRQRGGLKINGDTGFSYHCFNCGYTASFILGRDLSFKVRRLLEWLGVDSMTIEQINIESLRHRTMYGLIENQKQVIKAVEFEERDLPEDLEFIDSNNPTHEIYINYLNKRNIDYTLYPYMVSPSIEGRLSKRIVIPFTHNNIIVGNTARFLDNRTPKYISDTQLGYVFGTDLQQEEWQHLFVVEGIFDALSINAIAVLHNDINSTQAQVIKSLGKSVTVIPDQDEAGMALVNKAIELGWAVSIPDWPEGIKDVNDAVIRIGKIATLLTILQSRETNKYKIEIKRKQLVKRLRN